MTLLQRIFGASHTLGVLGLGASILASIYACNNNNHDDNKNYNGCTNCGGGPGGNPIAYSLNLNNAASLAVVDPSETNGGTSSGMHVSYSNMSTRDASAGSSPGGGGNGSGGQTQSAASLLNMQSDGNVQPAIVEAAPENMTPQEFQQAQDQPKPGGQRPPRVVAVGFASTGDAYVLFEYPFQFKAVAADFTGDPNSSDSGYRCQLFRATQQIDSLKTTEPTVGDTSNLECVTTSHEIPTWRQGRVMQFDQHGNLYFPGHTAGTNQDIFYKFDPTKVDAADENAALTEKVNARICYRDVEVTPSGSIFYTGTSNSSGDCQGTAFFRYISAQNQLIELSRGWWNFAYQVEKGVDRTVIPQERIVFYGPNPNSTTGIPGWESACLYRYDPTIVDPSARATALTSCMSNVWDWMSGGQQQMGGGPSATPLVTRRIQASRCELDGQVFLGGGGIDQLDQDKTGKIYIAGNVQKKIGGTASCNIQVTAAHCSKANAPLPDVADQIACASQSGNWNTESGWCSGASGIGPFDSEQACGSGGGVWHANSQWYSSVTGAACLLANSSQEKTDAEAAAAVGGNPTTYTYKSGWQVQNVQCAQQASSTSTSWTTTIDGLVVLPQPAALDGDVNAATALPILLSGTGEQVIRFWLVEQAGEETLYFSSYVSGVYTLKKRTKLGTGSNVTYRIDTLLENYEVYNLGQDPDVDSRDTRVLFDALNFSNNTYSVGTIDTSNSGDPDATAASIQVKEGLTGTLKALIIMPESD